MPLLAAYIVPHPPLIIPAVGNGRETGIQNTVEAYKKTAENIAAEKPDLIIFITPHGKIYDDYIHISPGGAAEGSFSRFGAPEARYALTYDELFIRHLSVVSERMEVPAGTLGGQGSAALDHGVLVPLHFILSRYADFKAARVSVSGLPFDTLYRFGQCIQKTLEGTGRRAVIIASGDLSHKLAEDGPYGYAPEGPAFDKAVCEAMREGDFLRFMGIGGPEGADWRRLSEKAAECGLRAFIMMAGAFEGFTVKPAFYSYEGPFGVGYGVCSFTPGEPGGERRLLDRYRRGREQQQAERRAAEDAYVQLARYTTEAYIRTGRMPAMPDGLPEALLTERAGTFVSIKKDGRLRGCIGTTEPQRASLAEEIAANAVSAGTRDPRFDAITEDEFPSLTYSVDILAPAEPVGGPDALDVLRYGVIVTHGTKRGLLLPNLDGVDTVENQISIALQKAGISPTAPYSLSRFEVVRHT